MSASLEHCSPSDSAPQISIVADPGSGARLHGCPDADGRPVPLETECFWEQWSSGIARNQTNSPSPKVLRGLSCAGGSF